jgi:acetoacetyl-CoA reductase
MIRTALVTGGAGGIGTAICRRLADDGFQVVAGYFSNGDHERASAWQDKQKSDGYDIDLIYSDVADWDSCVAMRSAFFSSYKTLDVLVNNAGITRDSTFRKMQPEQWNDVLRTNLDSVYNVTQQFIQSMLDNGWGRVINISSINGEKGQFGQANYSAAKAGLIGFSKALALEVAAKGVTVNCIAPGYVETEMTGKMKPEVLDSIKAQIPVGRLCTPQEVARTVSFLASPDSSFITGATIDINGGQYLR